MILAVDAELKKQSKPLKKLLRLLQFLQMETKKLATSFLMQWKRLEEKICTDYNMFTNIINVIIELN